MNKPQTSSQLRAALNRRRFLQQASLAAGAVLAAPAWLSAKSPNDKLNVAIIGYGNRGMSNAREMKSENIVAVCDVNEQFLDAAVEKMPGARKYVDFRKMYDEAKDIDAVVISAPEHIHAPATMMAIKQGKHVYCEKPLTHCIWESRVVAEAATKAKVATQMGTQIHATSNYRRIVELIQTGAIGPVREAHVWVSRAWGLQSEADAKANKDRIYVTERPKETMPVPPGLHWDLWLGPAPERPYHSIYFPGSNWYRWWDFGSGTMSDLGSHYNDLVFWALKLRAPLTVEAFGPPPHPEIAPASMSAAYEYGARGELPPVKVWWYQGTAKPEILKQGKIPAWDSGHLFIGDKGMLLCNYSKHLLLPEDKFKDFKRPEPFIAESPGQHAEWLLACKTGSPTLCHFDYSGALTEANHLANVAYRVGKKLEWDPVNLKAKNCPEADRLIRKTYRKGWSLG